MSKSINMVKYHEETETTFDNVRIITVKSGKELNEHGLRLKSTHYYYVITTNIENHYCDTKEWFISFKN